MSNQDALAVIVVHGVGGQKPYETAEEVASLLQRMPDPDNTGGANPYSEFEHQDLLLPIRPIRDALKDAKRDRSKSQWMLGSATEFAKRYEATEQDEREEPVDVAYTRSCIENFSGETDALSYRTRVLKGVRRDPGGNHRAVHIYEMYWADLSRLGPGLLALLGEIYQLLTHVGVLGQVAADMMWTSMRNRAGALRAALKVFRAAVGSAVWLGTVPLVVVNLMMFATALAVLPLHKSVSDMGWPWLLQSITVVVLAVGVGIVLNMYDKRRPDALVFGAVAGLVVPVMVFVSWGKGYLVAVLNTVEVYFRIIYVISGLLLLLLVAVLVLAAVCWWLDGRQALRKSAVTRSSVTSIVGLVVPLTLFCLFTVLIWSAFLPFFKSTLSTYTPYEAIVPNRIFSFIPGAMAPSRWPPDKQWDVSQFAFADFLMNHAGSQALNIMVIAAAVAIAWLLYGFAMSFFREIWPTPAVQPTATRICEADRDGRWVNRGLTTMSVLALLTIIVGGAYAMIAPLTGLCSTEGKCSSDYLVNAGSWLTGASAGLLAIFKGFSRAESARGGLDIALDVDNWLREHPRDHTARALIMSRYYALLLHLWSEGYKRVLIVSHSQGTVITADLLRLIKHGRHPLGMTVDMLTVGCPLRQLYAARFPVLYGWVLKDLDGAGKTGPHPDELGVNKWLNGYRTGDYVGRALWKDVIDTLAFMPGPDAAALLQAGNYGDFCVGGGAHTHYFDHTAPEVGRAVDVMVRA